MHFVHLATTLLKDEESVQDNHVHATWQYSMQINTYHSTLSALSLKASDTQADTDGIGRHCWPSFLAADI